MRAFTDQLGRTVVLRDFPKRIVSLVPSLTELLFDMGLEKEIVGITRFCVEPRDKVKSIPKVGGTKNFDILSIRDLSPDLIIASKEENVKEKIHEIENDFPVWVSDVRDFESAIEVVNELSEITNKKSKGNELINKILYVKDIVTSEFSELVKKRNKVLYFIWRRPYMVVGSDNYINSLLKLLGFQNIILNFDYYRDASKNMRYPSFTESELRTFYPDFVFLSSEPYPFSEKNFDEFSKIFPTSILQIVRGDYFSWYGSRFSKSLEYFLNLKNQMLQKLNMNFL